MNKKSDHLRRSLSGFGITAFSWSAFALLAAGSASADGLEQALTRNALCADAGITQLVYSDIRGIPSRQNFCEVPVESLPGPVRDTIDVVNRVHHGMANVLSSTVGQTFGLGFTVEIRGNNEGPLISHATGDGMVVGAFPDWKPSDFPAMVYAHELVHVLTFNGGSFSTPIAGLRHHPFLIEALPDLIAAAVNGSPILDLGDSSLPECVNNLRDETPLQSLDLPLQHYYQRGSRDRMVKCCKGLSVDQKVGRTAQICAAYSGGSDSKLFTREELMAPFQPESCFSSKHGFTLFEKCDTHQFGYPLTSFFFALEQKIARPIVAEFLRQITQQASNARVYECKYVRPGQSLPKPVVLKVRNVLPLFTAFREGLSASEQQAFDETWVEHSMEKMAKLDRLYSPHAPKAEAVRELAEKNFPYAAANRCMDLNQMNPRACDIQCLALDP